ncbi:hypothetical protein SAMN04487895_101587 [Paenibacillus sophorae]|uniref:Uncharacterized protein n=1 Tax=Paenibacillus sophorae TaxID=1333845 RepID=A0A1H8GNM8_9BACL|nr:hypothetical protein [Paenibacillus sophorae]QWU14288.1 hypothetical protein KP014_20490 [Paenibacillus sophorae]SEN45576.1 hypothetical protein SAMN04487895_101587 [Paenibacillus sophorae]
MMEPYELAEGERYTDNKSVRMIQSIDVSKDVIKYIENPRGGHVLGICGIEDFCNWAKSCYTLENELWEISTK